MTLYEWIIGAGGAIAIAALALSAWREQRRADRLSKELDDILDCISEGVVKYDGDMRLERCNRRFREIYARTAPALTPGASLREILTFGVRAGQWPEARHREQEWIEERLQVQGDTSKDMLTRVDGERWILVRNRRTPDGGTIGVRADVSDLEAAKRAAEQTSNALHHANARLHAALDEITYYANRDPLTGLYNRRFLDKFIDNDQGALDDFDDVEISVVHIDLDRFKQVNDEFGHAAGDEVLKHAANVLRAAATDQDLVARTGGDEFVVVLGPAWSGDAVAAFAEDLIKALSQPIAFEGASLLVGASVGVARARPRTSEIRQAILDADAALYIAKGQGRNRARFYEASASRDLTVASQGASQGAAEAAR